MPLDPLKIALAMDSGLSAVCSTCARYWEGRDRGLPEPTCTTPAPCGSPLAGLDFPHYDGPIANFERFCFVCGDNSVFGVRTHGKTRTIGVCGKHVRLIAELQPQGRKGPPLPVREIRGVDETITAEDLIRPRKKTLGEAIMEVESHFQNEEKP